MSWAFTHASIRESLSGCLRFDAVEGQDSVTTAGDDIPENGEAFLAPFRQKNRDSFACPVPIEFRAILDDSVAKVRREIEASCERQIRELGEHLYDRLSTRLVAAGATIAPGGGTGGDGDTLATRTERDRELEERLVSLERFSLMVDAQLREMAPASRPMSLRVSSWSTDGEDGSALRASAVIGDPSPSGRGFELLGAAALSPRNSANRQESGDGTQAAASPADQAAADGVTQTATDCEDPENVGKCSQRIREQNREECLLTGAPERQSMLPSPRRIRFSEAPESVDFVEEDQAAETDDRNEPAAVEVVDSETGVAGDDSDDNESVGTPVNRFMTDRTMPARGRHRRCSRDSEEAMRASDHVVSDHERRSILEDPLLGGDLRKRLDAQDVVLQSLVHTLDAIAEEMGRLCAEAPQ